MIKSISLLYYLKRSKTNPNTGMTPIYLRITVDGKRSELSLNRFIDASRWNPKAGKAIGTNDTSKSINAFLDTHRMKVLETHRRMLENGVDISSDGLKNAFLGIGAKEKTLLDIMKYHDEKMKALIDIEYSRGTYKKYQTSSSHLKQFVNWKYKVKDISLKLVNHEFVIDYDFFMRTELKLSNNTTIKYMKNFKKLVRIAISNGWMEKDPFLNYKAKYQELEKLYLTKEELETIEKKHFGIERLNLVKDMFLFSCYTGLAYADVSKLTDVNQVKGIDGEDWIVIDRTKTKARCRIPLLTQAKYILKKYSSHPNARIKGLLLPVLSNQKMNAYLKEIADLCGFEKNLTFHVARHTFATTVTLSNDVPLESVSSMLGHSTTVMTQHYAKVVDKKLSKDVAELRSKMLKTQ